MGVLLGFAFLAGIVTVLSPCILPVLPIVLANTAAEGRRRPLGVIAGFTASFSVLTLSLATLVRALGLDPELPRTAAAVLIVGFAAVLLVPPLKDRFTLAAGRFTSAFGRRTSVPAAAADRRRPSGFWSGFLTGLGLGAVWTPCVGPIMASVITAAVVQTVDYAAVGITAAYAAGTSLPLFAVMRGGRALINRRPALMKRLPAIQRIFAVLMLLTGVSLLAGWDRSFQSYLLAAFPGYGSGLTALEDNEAVKAALESRASALAGESPAGAPAAQGTEARKIDFTGPDPLSRSSGPWHNSPPLTLAGLKGKVVLVDFWTYSCVNCQRTIPYLAAWHGRYRDAGLAVVGVHSPEFVFERDSANLKAAMAELGVSWPVVQDNDFGIWRAFSNRYWPAKYLFDRSGKLVYTHYGEGAYEETERMIQGLLGLPDLGRAAAAIEPEATVGGRNSETYLGSERAELQAEQEKDAAGRFAAPAALGRFQWALEGRWRQEAEYIEADSGSILSLDFYARRVLLVIEPVGTAGASLRVSVDGAPTESADVRAGVLRPAESRLYELFSAESAQKGILKIEADGPVRLFAFTFS
jgi:cytochrome c biogenesis protein CcdA/thiol-disulfide isomerase/thioredoxin